MDPVREAAGIGRTVVAVVAEAVRMDLGQQEVGNSFSFFPLLNDWEIEDELVFLASFCSFASLNSSNDSDDEQSQ